MRRAFWRWENGKINIIEEKENEILVDWTRKHNYQFLKFKKKFLNSKMALQSNLHVE